MCGIVGIVRGSAPTPETSPLGDMASSLGHRGPDDGGTVRVPFCELSFRRLSIMDPDAPSPPYANGDRSVWSVCNGEIYNAGTLKEDLIARGHRFRTSVDTEVLPFLYEEYGTDLCRHLDGMFAFAIWESRKRTLLLGRDRFGEKPLFYCDTGGEFVFASEIRALLRHPAVPRAIDPHALRRYLLHGFFPAPLTPVHGIKKLPAAHTLTLRRGEVEVKRFWDLADCYAMPRLRGRTADLAAELDDHLGGAIRRRSKSDVPAGVFLSGGIDSTTILAHATEQMGRGVPAISLGHADRSFDETRFARQTAEHFGADYHEIVLGDSDLEEGLRRVAAGFDEPLADPSIIPTHMLSLAARRAVKVALSGEGGDELFAGYPTYVGNKIAQTFNRVPRWLQVGVGRIARALGPASMGNVSIDYMLKRFLASANMNPIERHHAWFGCVHPGYHAAVLSPEMMELLRDDDPFEDARRVVRGREFPDVLSRLLYSDAVLYLQDNLLTKVDRASMLASLEVRAPLLDRQVAEFAARLSSDVKLRGLKTKWILRKAEAARLPAAVLSRRKRGFSIPLGRWLTGSLGASLMQRFSAPGAGERRLFNPAGVVELLRQHRAREVDHGKALFAVMMFELWCDRMYGEGRPPQIASPAEARESRGMAS